MRKLKTGWVRLILIMAAAVLGWCASGAPTLESRYWGDKDYDPYSGRCFSEADCWRKKSGDEYVAAGAVPGALTYARFWFDANRNISPIGYKVTLPKGTYDNYSTLVIHARQDNWFELDGTDSYFRSPSTAAENYGPNLLQIFCGGAIPSDGQSGMTIANPTFKAGYVLSNAILRVQANWSNPGVPGQIRFQQGLFNFYDPEGMPLDSTLEFYTGTHKNDNMPVMTFEEGSSLRIMNMKDSQYQLGPVEIRFQAGEHWVPGKFTSERLGDGSESSERSTEVHVENTAKLHVGNLVFHNNNDGKNRKAYNHRTLAVENGGSLTVTSGLSYNVANNPLLCVTNGSSASFSGAENCVAAYGYVADDDPANAMPIVVDDSELAFAADKNLIGNVDMKLHPGAKLTVSGESNFGRSHSFAFNPRISADQATLAFSGTTKFGPDKGTRADLFLTNCTVTAAGETSVGGSGNGVLELKDSTLTATGTFNLGSGWDSSGGTLRAIDSEIDFTGLTGAINISSGSAYGPFSLELRGSSVYKGSWPEFGAASQSSHLASTATNRIVVADSSKMMLNSNLNGTWVRYRNGVNELSVEGGELSCYYVSMANVGKYGNFAPQSTFRQTGGKVTVTAGTFSKNENDWYAFNAGDRDADNASVSSVILDGGELHVHRIRARRSAAETKWTMQCHFSANGGTIVGLKSNAGYENNVTLRNFDTAKLGEKGLTIRTAYETNTEQDFTDLDGHEGKGLLKLEGAGVKNLMGTNSQESYLVAAGGTVRFVRNGDVDAKHYSNLIVTNGATVSTAGAQTGARFRSAVFGAGGTDAAFALETSDRVVSDGALSIPGSLTLQLADETLPDEGDYPLFTASGEADAATVANWESATVIGPAGRVYATSSAYDGSAGKTVFTLTVSGTGPLTGEVEWNGEWTCTGSDLLKFTGKGTASVDVPAKVTVGAMRFDSALDYTLAGAGLITFSDRGGYAKIDVVNGKIGIDSAVKVPSDMKLDVASGSTLTVSGKVNGGGLVKSGKGVATLSNGENVLPAGVTVTAGTLKAEPLSALGAKGSLTLAGGTTAVDADGGTYARAVRVDTGDPAVGTILRTESDLTLTDFAAVSGAFIKTGAGRLTIDVPDGAVVGAAGAGDCGNTFDSARNTLDIDGEGNLTPAEKGQSLEGFAVGEGELVFRGRGRETLYEIKSRPSIGMTANGGAVQPTLVVDNAQLKTPDYFHAFDCYRNDWTTDAYLYVTNNGLLACQFRTAVGSGNAGTEGKTFHCTVADGGELWGSYLIDLQAPIASEFVFERGGRCTANNGGQGDYADAKYPTFKFQGGPVTMTFNEDSVFCRRRKLGEDTPLAAAILGNANNDSLHEMVFNAGSACYLSMLSNAYDRANVKLTFNGGRWSPFNEGGSGDFRFDFLPYGGFVFNLTGEGLTLEPGAGDTWTVANAFTGTGKLVKKGAGTLAFATPDDGTTVPLGFTGGVEVREGAVAIAPKSFVAGAKVDLSEGTSLTAQGTVAGLSVGGEGTVAGGILDAPTFCADGTSYVTVAADVSLSGKVRIDCGRTADDPLADGVEIPVVKLASGALPDTSRWRFVNTGTGKASGKHGQFRIDANGVVWGKPVTLGFSLTIR